MGEGKEFIHSCSDNKPKALRKEFLYSFRDQDWAKDSGLFHAPVVLFLASNFVFSNTDPRNSVKPKTKRHMQIGFAWKKSSKVEIEVLCSSGSPAPTYQATRHHYPQGHSTNLHYNINILSYGIQDYIRPTWTTTLVVRLKCTLKTKFQPNPLCNLENQRWGWRKKKRIPLTVCPLHSSLARNTIQSASTK